ncbi:MULTISPECIES: MFS transporter [unclassified Nocardia]|uniref:MFS transporter n=1 Tax=unclassified Nocardia TaxID=2637762 RepID=UPI001CE4159E|nr:MULTISPECIES: MFS transporter [unclassified Nocardia]
MTLVEVRDAPPAAPEKRWRAAVRFTGIAAGNFMITMDATVLNVALPDMRRELHAPAAALPWAVDAYTVVLAGMLLASGALADRWGPRRVYRAALAAFAAVSVLCAAASNVGVLIAGRALLGIPAAGLVPASMALLAVLYPDTAVRSRRIGALIAITGVAIAAGPVFGGALVALDGWRLVFLVNPPIALLAFLAARGLREHPTGIAKPFDKYGISLTVLALTALTFGLVDGGTGGWARFSPIAACVVAALAFSALPAAHRRAAAPVLPPALLRLTRVRVDLLVAIVAQLVYYGLLFSMSQWMVEARGMTALTAGLAFLPMTVPIILVPTLTGRLVARYGARPLMIAGMAVTLAGGVVLSTCGTSLWVLFLVEVLIGVGGPLATPAYIADMSAAVPLEFAATGQGALNAARQTGTALGVAIFGTLSGLPTTGVVITAAVVVVLAVLANTRRAA